MLPPSVDSALVEYVGRFAVERLATRIASAAQLGDRHWWQISFPKGPEPQRWDRLERHLLAALRGRGFLPGDSGKGILSVSGVRLSTNSDTLEFRMEVGSAFLCQGRWMENTRGATYVAHRSSGTWMHDVQVKDVVWSESFEC
jgi:hypothetical protein